MWSTHRAFQPRRGVVEGCLKVPAPERLQVISRQLPWCISYLLPLFSLFLLVLFSGCWAGSPTGMLWGNYAMRVTVGCCPGEARWDGRRRVSVCPTPVLTLSCVCRDWRTLLCTHPCIALGCTKVVCSGKVQEGFFFASNAIPLLWKRVLSAWMSSKGMGCGSCQAQGAGERSASAVDTARPGFPPSIIQPYIPYPYWIPSKSTVHFLRSAEVHPQQMQTAAVELSMVAACAS